MSIFEQEKSKWRAAARYTLDNPDSKRFPAGLNVGQHRQGRDTLTVFCEAYRQYCTNFPQFSRMIDCPVIDSCFDLEDKRESH